MVKAWLAFVAIPFLLPQDPSPARQESVSMFREIARLAALAPENRKDAGAAASKWPPFYSDVLKSEWRQRDELGAHFGRESGTVTLQGSDHRGGHLREFEKQAGIRLVKHPLRNVPDEAVVAEFDKVPPMEALIGICRAAKLGVRMDPLAEQIFLNGAARQGGYFCYRNILVLHGETSTLRTIDFSGRPSGTADLEFFTVWDRGITIATWQADVVLLEAVTDTGVSLEAAPGATPPVFEESEESVTGDDVEVGASHFGLSLGIPHPVPAKIARLRFQATAMVPVDTREFTIRDFSTPETSRAADTGFEVSVKDLNPKARDQRKTEVTVRPLRMKAEDLRKLPVRFDMAYQDDEPGVTHCSGVVTGDAVVYTVYWSAIDRGRIPLDLKRVTLRIPTKLGKRIFTVEMTDVPLKE